MKIVVDVLGGDNSPDVLVEGAIMALNKNSELKLVLVGDEKIIKNLLLRFQFDDFSRLEIIHAPEVIGNHESPASAVRSRENASIVAAYRTLKEREDCIGLVSAGSSGAVLSGALLRLGRIKGVHRPAILSTFPTIIGGKVLLIDSGANVDAKPEYLEQFALIGNTYCKVALGVENPRIGLLNVGVEEGKGNELTKAAFELIKSHPELNFIGNVEARDYLSGNVDIIVSDGFSGNILMKATEGAALNIMKKIKEAIYGSLLGKIGGLLIKRNMKKVKKFFDYGSYGGAFFIGCEKLVCKAHGSSKALSISIAIEETFCTAKKGVVADIKKIVGERLV